MHYCYAPNYVDALLSIFSEEATEVRSIVASWTLAVVLRLPPVCHLAWPDMFVFEP